MNKHYLFSALIITLYALLTANCNTYQTNDQTDQKILSIDSLNNNEITIIKDSVNVYFQPGKNRVVAVLNNGDRCNYISKGEVDTIDNIIDFWYQISIKGQKGWVFGSNTSLIQNSGFENFLRVFSNDFNDSISLNYANRYLKGNSGFFPLEYKRLSNGRFAALFIKRTLQQDAEILLMIYEFGIPVNDYILFRGNYDGCTVPQAFFTSKDFVKLIGPVCKTSVANYTYYQILEDNRLKELKSSIVAKSVNELLPKIKAELKVIDNSMSEECKCAINSNVSTGYSDKNVIYYSILKDECDVSCNSYDYSLIAMPDSLGWTIKFEEKGIFQSMYESGIENKYILVLKETRKNHIYGKKVVERIYLIDKEKQLMQELNLKSESCVILAPDQYGCDYCPSHSSLEEELIFQGNPVTQVIKKVKIISYDGDDACKRIEQRNYSTTYTWNPSKLIFELIQ